MPQEKDKQDIKHLGNLLRQHREMREYTLADVSSALDISKESLRKIETGKVKNASVMTWLKLAVFLDVPKENVWNLVKYLCRDDLLQAHEYIKAISSLEILQQKTIVDIAQDGGLNSIEYKQTVCCVDPCLRPVTKRVHSLDSIRPALKRYNIKNIKAYDDDGELGVKVLDDKLDHRIEFFVFFRTPLSHPDGTYQYSWRAELVPNIFKFVNLRRKDTNLDFSWYYNPYQYVHEYQLIIKHPEDFRLGSLDEFRRVERLPDSFAIERMQRSVVDQSLSFDLVEDNRFETRLTARKLPKGLYKFDWRYVAPIDIKSSSITAALSSEF